jgi:hypothetical protein
VNVAKSSYTLDKFISICRKVAAFADKRDAALKEAVN